MLGWVITCHDDRAQEILDALEKKHGALLQCRAVNFWRGLTSNMLSRMMCDALHETDSGEGVIFFNRYSRSATVPRGFIIKPQALPLRSDFWCHVTVN